MSSAMAPFSWEHISGLEFFNRIADKHHDMFRIRFGKIRDGSALAHAIAETLVAQDMPEADFERVLRKLLQSGAISSRFSNCQVVRRTLGGDHPKGGGGAKKFEDYLCEACRDDEKRATLAAMWVLFRVLPWAPDSKPWKKWKEWEINIALILQTRWPNAFQLRETQTWGDGLEA